MDCQHSSQLLPLRDLEGVFSISPSDPMGSFERSRAQLRSFCDKISWITAAAHELCGEVAVECFEAHCIIRAVGAFGFGGRTVDPCRRSYSDRWRLCESRSCGTKSQAKIGGCCGAYQFRHWLSSSAATVLPGSKCVDRLACLATRA